MKENPASPGTFTIDKIDEDYLPPDPNFCLDSAAGLVVFDAGAPTPKPLVYAAFQCNGFGVFEHDPNAALPADTVVLRSYWVPPAGQGRSVMKVMRGAETAGAHRLMLAGVNHGLGVIDDAFVLSGGGAYTSITWWSLPFQAAEILPASSDLRRWWVACTRDGIVQVDFSGIFP